MVRPVLISVLVVFAVAPNPKVSSRKSLQDGRIIGGVATTIQDLPYQVSVQLHGSHICGGSIISPKKILTAAHCIAGSSASSLSARVGSTYHDRGGTVVPVASICSHPQYNKSRFDNDVSVLILTSSLKLTNATQPIVLPKVGSSAPVGIKAVVSGWGTTSEDGSFSSLSPVLQKVEVPRVSQQDCRKVYGQSKISDSMTCYGYPAGGKDFCHGDSGGPLAIGRTQVGVVSIGSGCAQAQSPGVYADITKAIIQNHINSC